MKTWKKIVIGTLAALFLIGVLLLIGTVIRNTTDRFITVLEENREYQLKIKGCLELIGLGTFEGKKLPELRDECQEVVDEYQAEQLEKRDVRINKLRKALER